MSEKKLQTAISDYLKLAYPKVVFTSESSGIRVSMGVAVQMKRQRSRHSLPDMIILEPKGLYHGLVLEIKNKQSDIYLKDGNTFRSSEHIQKQLSTLNILSEKGYKSLFVCGLEDAIETIDSYMTISI